MCYSNCPNEIYGGDAWGECLGGRGVGEPGTHCHDETCECGAELEDGKCPECKPFASCGATECDGYGACKDTGEL